MEPASQFALSCVCVCVQIRMYVRVAALTSFICLVNVNFIVIAHSESLHE